MDDTTKNRLIKKFLDLREQKKKVQAQILLNQLKAEDIRTLGQEMARRKQDQTALGNQSQKIDDAIDGLRNAYDSKIGAEENPVVQANAAPAPFVSPSGVPETPVEPRPVDLANAEPESAPEMPSPSSIPPEEPEAEPTDENGETEGETDSDNDQTRTDTETTQKEGADGKNAAAKVAETAEKVKKTEKLIAKLKNIKWLMALINSGWLVPVIIIAIVVAVAIAFAIAYPYLKGKGGKTPQIAAQPVKDRTWIDKTLLLTGDKEIQAALSDELFGKLKTELTDTKAKITDAETLASIDTVIAEIDTYMQGNPRDSAAGTKAITDLQAMMRQYYDKYPAFTNINIGYPFQPFTIAAYNSNPHTGTVWETDAKIKSHGTVTNLNEGNCDATDIFPSDSLAVLVDNKKVQYFHPIFTGKVSIQDNPAVGKVISITSGDWTARYILSSPLVTDGQNVMDVNTRLGTLVGKYLQLELIYKYGQTGETCVVANRMDRLLQPTSKVAPGEYTWNEIKKVIKLTGDGIY